MVSSQDGASDARSPVLLTVKTTGVALAGYRIAVTEQGEMTMRWNWSRWVPTASATTALMGSAWETATMV
jgi:hypothetical protein